MKSIKNNCKAAKITNEDLRYQVRLGHNNLELWIKNIGDPDYLQVEPTLFGPYTQPNLDKITTQPNLGISPPQGRTLKRARDSPDTTKNLSKRPTVTLNNLKLRPSWMDPETSTPIKTTNKNNTPTPVKSPNQTPSKPENQNHQEPAPQTPAQVQEESPKFFTPVK